MLTLTRVQCECIWSIGFAMVDAGFPVNDAIEAMQALAGNVAIDILEQMSRLP